jgi:hypothetical protein
MAETDQSHDYPIVNQLDVGINAVEDRVAMIVSTKGHGQRAVFLTRRLLKQLLKKYADVLEQTSTTASQAAAGHKDEILQMEHISALSQIDQETAEKGDGGSKSQKVEAPDEAYLATNVHFRVQKGQIVLAFDGVQRGPAGADATQKHALCAFRLDRVTAHRVLAMLQDKANEAGWDLPKPSGWTDKLQQAKAGAVN